MATVVLLVFLPVMILMALFAIYVSQQYLTHIRNMEATEVTALAMIARENQKLSTSQDLTYANNLIQRYMGDSLKTEVNLSKTQCAYGDGCDIAYVRNTLRVSTVHDSWLASLQPSKGKAPLFEPQFNVIGGEIVAEKYVARPVDIHFIVDMSGSMRKIWLQGHGLSRIEAVKYTIKNVLDYLKTKQNPDYPARVSMSVYNSKSIQKIGSDTYSVEHSYNGSSLSPIYHYPTFKMMWIHPKDWVHHPEIPVYEGKRKILVKKAHLEFHDLTPTTDYSDFYAKFSTFYPYGPTASWQGIIAAAQMADKATNDPKVVNPEQIFILLADGYDDSDDKPMANALIEKYKMCNEIRKRIGSKNNRFSAVGGAPTKVTMGVIGVDFDGVTKNSAFKSCFGNKIYVAKTGADEIYKHILTLIEDVSGHLKAK
ncbi:hypothetical protein [Vibrio sp. SCSIO 43137]|uniref:hypothetical protein n=1 Tax=Vibrio sp. SCSIO 43137 TaxID=3021011 RepID=UPI00230835D4|nr:hypothetical protein [Vibrio sp. SCSIO 43137]WCE32565.1 hypothetical protein PK654_18930 [Vibrio sp. SCSIO 43137]